MVRNYGFLNPAKTFGFDSKITGYLTGKFTRNSAGIEVSYWKDLTN